MHPTRTAGHPWARLEPCSRPSQHRSHRFPGTQHRSAVAGPSAPRTAQKLLSLGSPAPAGAAMELTVQFGKDQRRLELPAVDGGGGGAAGPSCADLTAALASEFGVAPHTIKLLVPGGKGLLRLEEQGAAPLEQAGAPALPRAAGRRV